MNKVGKPSSLVPQEQLSLLKLLRLRRPRHRRSVDVKILSGVRTDAREEGEEERHRELKSELAMCP